MILNQPPFSIVFIIKLFITAGYTMYYKIIMFLKLYNCKKPIAKHLGNFPSIHIKYWNEPSKCSFSNTGGCSNSENPHSLNGLKYAGL